MIVPSFSDCQYSELRIFEIRLFVVPDRGIGKVVYRYSPHHRQPITRADCFGCEDRYAWMARRMELIQVYPGKCKAKSPMFSNRPVLCVTPPLP